MPLSPIVLVRALRDAQRPVGVKELLRLTGIHPGQQTEVKRVLRELLRSGELVRDGKRFSLPAPKSRKTEHAAAGADGRGHGAGGARGRGPREEAAHDRHRQREREAEAWSPGRPQRGGRTQPFGDEGGRGARGAPGERGRGGRAARGGPELGRGEGRRQLERGDGPGRAPAGHYQTGYARREAAELERPGRGGTGRTAAKSGRPQPGGRRGQLRPERGQERGFERGYRRRPSAGAELVDGLLSLHRDGFGFVRRSDGEGDDIFIPPHEARRALDKDRVRVEVVPSEFGRPGGRTEGHIVEVLERRREQAVGTYVVRGDEALVLPNDTSLQGPIRVPPTQLAVEGDLVKVQLGIGAELIGPGEGLFGEVTGSLGRPGDPSAEVLSIVFSQGFKDEFPPDVMQQADRVPLKVSEHEATGEDRRDLRWMDLVTIDSEDARDFDDAVYAEPAEDGTRLVVAIADVTHYVREHTPLDVEGYSRGTSVYLPNRVLPMLPERLSAGICSLRPEEDRLCMVADMVLDDAGGLVRYELYPAVMRSAARCTYNEVQAVLDGEDVPHRNRFKPHFQRLWALAQKLNKKRVARGAIDFDLPETKVVMGKDGLPERMERRERKDAHRLIEECMLAANEVVAQHFSDEELPTIYRFHGSPDEDKLERFAGLAKAHGFHLRAKAGEITSRQLADLVREMEGHPEQRALNQLLLRSMMQAVYSSENVGHYGLAAEYYLHFTSPIRRYPDLIVHRLLKQKWARGNHRPSEGELERQTEKLEEMAVHSSERERAAMQVEREVVAFYSTLLMKDRLGETFAATVSSVVDFGCFVELDQEFVEGLVKAESVGSGARFDERLNALTFASGRKIRVGDKLTVRLTGASLERRQLDFTVVAFEGEAPVETSGGREGFERLRHRRPGARPERTFGPAKTHPGKTHGGQREKAPRHRPPPIQHPEPVPDPEPASELGVEVETEPFVPSEASPHPGFDRLRALAARARGGGRPPKGRR